MKKKELILDLIFQETALTRERIINTTGIGKSTVGKIVNKLLKEKKVVEDGSISEGKGRASRILKVNPELGYILSVTSNNGEFTGGVVNLDKKLIFKCKSPFPQGAKASFANDLISCIKKIEKNLGTDKRKIIGTGIALSGSFDSKEKVILGLRGQQRWKPLSLKNIINENSGKEVFLFDDTDVLARAEYEARKEEKISNLLYIYSGKGIGLGIILNGKLFAGSRGNAGEIGHLVVDETGERCYCGNYGCLETFAGINSIFEQVRKGIKEGVHSEIEAAGEDNLDKLTTEKIALAVSHHDKLVTNIVEKAAGYIGKVSASLVNIFNPEIVVLGGPLTLTGKIFLSTVEKQIRRESLPQLLKNMRIEFSKLSPEDVIIGTALPVIDQLKEKRWLPC